MIGTLVRQVSDGEELVTEGLTPLDRERAASIADEGGASAATVETQRRASQKDEIDPDDTQPYFKRKLEGR
jgi:hypothetical protein